MRITDEYKVIWDRNATLKGTPTGGTRSCQMEGCLGTRIAVRWPDGSITYPCTRGLVPAPDGNWQIG